MKIEDFLSDLGWELRAGSMRYCPGFYVGLFPGGISEFCDDNLNGGDLQALEMQDFLSELSDSIGVFSQIDSIQDGYEKVVRWASKIEKEEYLHIENIWLSIKCDIDVYDEWCEKFIKTNSDVKTLLGRKFN